MDKGLLLVGIWIAGYMLSLVALIMIDAIGNDTGKIKDEDRTFFLAVPFFITTCITFIIGGLIL